MDSPGGELGFSSAFVPTPIDVANIKELARSGVCPMDSQLSKLRITMAAAPVELDRYDADIERLQTALSRLTSERSVLASYTDFCRSVLSPIQRLPNELLADIFDFCLPDDLYMIFASTTDDEVDRLARRYLLQLGQVCTRWHRVAMDTPKLWSTIAVDTEVWKWSFIGDARLADLLESSLARGRNSPLTLHMGISNSDSDVVVFEALLEHAHRWKNVFVSSSGAPCVALSSAMISLDQLEMLDLNVDSWGRLPAFQNAPRLRYLAFSGYVGDLPLLPWTQIKTIVYDSHDTPGPRYSPLSVLNRAPQCANGTFYLDLRECPPHEPWEVDIKSRLNQLFFQLLVSEGDDAVAANLFDALTLPNLEALEIYPSDGTSPPIWSSTHFLALVERSGFDSCLTWLAIRAVVSDEGLLRCLRALPKLERLFFTECGSSPASFSATITDNFLRGLFLVRGMASVIPNLRLLSLRCGLDFSDSVYADLLATRARLFDGKSAFGANLWWFGPRKWEFSVEAMERINQLALDGGIIFNTGEYNPAVHDSD
ncbi:hypothetical protein R3P38DRAFT_2844889 [Favolaschia claudopus]|uniref:F-box domain-containing protein n=1 Tax=Favolaschia claudopus TaxID=2862362 RepID=A0AAW0DZX6_9AGAR